jgi:hypothetical protein
MTSRRAALGLARAAPYDNRGCYGASQGVLSQEFHANCFKFYTAVSSKNTESITYRPSVLEVLFMRFSPKSSLDIPFVVSFLPVILSRSVLHKLLWIDGHIDPSTSISGVETDFPASSELIFDVDTAFPEGGRLAWLCVWCLLPTSFVTRLHGLHWYTSDILGNSRVISARFRLSSSI